MARKSWKNKYGVVKNGVLKEFTVYRNKWHRGASGSHLLTAEGNHCCVGFMALACGVPKSELLGANYVTSLNRSSALKILEAEDLDFGYNDILGALSVYHVNDNRNLSDAQREKTIKRIFWDTFGVKVHFKGKKSE